MTAQLALFKKNAKSFSFAANILGDITIKKIVTLYEFCRLIDDIADESTDKSSAEQSLRDIARDIKNQHSDKKIIADFINFIKTENINTSYILDLLDGVVSDCKDTITMQDDAQLLQYAYRVAGTVGAMMCSVLGVDHKNIKQAIIPAIHLGIAMQLTNIARDIREDAQNNRVYIPQSWKPFNHFMLMNKPNTENENAHSACRKILDLADLYYESSKAGYVYLPLRSRICILVASDLYRAIGVKIRKKDFRYWEGRVYLNIFEKFMRLIITLPKILLPNFWFKIKKLNNQLYCGEIYA